MIVSLVRASQNKRALMNQSRVYWTIGKTTDGRTMTSEKGLIKFFNISSSEDDQIDEDDEIDDFDEDDDFKWTNRSSSSSSSS